MENVFFKGICQIGIFMICAQTFVHFCPNGSYEKYLKMLVSIMVLVQILSPLGAILGGRGQELKEMQLGAWLEEVLMQSMDEVLQEGSLRLDGIEEGLKWEAGQDELVGNGTEGENAESVWQSDVQGNEAASESNAQQQTESIYIEPIAPIRVGQ